MPSNLTPSTAGFTTTGAILSHKDGWTSDYSEALAENTGYNFQHLPRYMSEYTIGADPAPPTDDRGGHVGILHEFTTNNAELLDDELDWRDRLLVFTGGATGDDPDADEDLPGGTYDEDIRFGRYYSNVSPYTLALIGAVGNGDVKPAMSLVTYTKGGRAAPPVANTDYDKCIMLLHWNAGGAAWTTEVGIYCDTTGDLYGIVLTPAALTNSLAVFGSLTYYPQTGYRDT